MPKFGADQKELIFFFPLNLDNKCLIWTVHVASGSQFKLFQRLPFLAKEGEVRIRQHPGFFYTTAAKSSKNRFGQFPCSSLSDRAVAGPQKPEPTTLKTPEQDRSLPGA